ncbi:MAG TPA: bifunctional precorrin-2 dehydrogenase/sirohydrochlorin ferrochelatase [Rubrobacter sp.]|nr:bifunctional precorrin-2 dehydrogenase/sirohydrochlorin ferrochelatase [Rubrobacter sp.]
MHRPFYRSGAEIGGENTVLYPIFLNLSGRRCVVVGGGAVASRKAGKLLQAGADVVVVSPEVRTELAGMDVEIQNRAYEYGDLEGANLVFTATDSREVNAAVAKEAKERGVPVNVADRPSEGDFAVPSTLRRGGLQVAVSTGGASPTLARRIRNELEEAFGPEWAGVVREFDTARRSGGAPGQDVEEEVSRCLSRLRG